MTKFSTNEKLNRSIDRAQARRAKVSERVKVITDEYIARQGGNPDGAYAYMTGFLESLLGTVAQAESIAEVRRALAYSGIKL